MATDGPTRPRDDPPPAHRMTVSEEQEIPLPPAVMEHLDLEPGDEIRWTLTEDGDLTVEKVEGEWGAFDDFEPVDMGETNAVEEHDLAGYEPAMTH